MGADGIEPPPLPCQGRSGRISFLSGVCHPVFSSRVDHGKFPQVRPYFPGRDSLPVTPMWRSIDWCRIRKSWATRQELFSRARHRGGHGIVFWHVCSSFRGVCHCDAFEWIPLKFWTRRSNPCANRRQSVCMPSNPEAEDGTSSVVRSFASPRNHQRCNEPSDHTRQPCPRPTYR